MNLNQYGLKRSEVELLINEWIFNERNRSITKRKLLDGVTFEKLAEEYRVNLVTFW